MKNTILFIMSLLFVIASLQAQPLENMRSLTIGDKVPNIELDNIVNYKTTTANLSDFRGKLLVLDFWATWCSSCIKGFPKLAQLQTEFKDDLRILLVNAKNTNDTKKKISSFLKKKNLLSGGDFHLPVVIEDTVLNQLFPYQMLPHYVWISRNGELIATTASDQVTEKNIKDLLAGKDVQFRMKEDLIDFDRSKPLFLNDQLHLEKDVFKYYSGITGYLSGLPSGISGHQDSAGQVNRLSITNANLKQLYKIAFQVSLPNNRIIYDLSDSSDFFCSGDDCAEWKYSHFYCYEVYGHSFPHQDVYKTMQQDLRGLFGYQAKKEKRKINCLVIRTNRSQKKPLSKGGKPVNNLGTYGEKLYIRNQPLSQLINYLDRILPIPVFDETNYDEHLDLNLPHDLSNIQLLKATLSKYGFTVSEEKRLLEVFVISDR